jgi:putative transposase
LTAPRGKILRFDNGAELASHAMLRWGAEHAIDLHFIDPGKPVQNAHIESFNGKARDEFLNLHSFLTLDQAREAAAEWLIDFNEIRPHSSIGNRTPKEFAEHLAINQSSQLSAA